MFSKKKLVLDFIENHNEKKYHEAHKIKAFKLLKVVESENGKTNPRLIKLCNEYAHDILGRKVYAPWLYVYSAVAGEFKEGWIPDNYYKKVVIPKEKGDYRMIGDLKSLTNKIFSSNLFPDLAYYINGLWVTPDYNVISEDTLRELIFKTSQKIVFKLDSSVQGRGIYFFDNSNFDSKKIRKLGNGVVQDYIKQHAFFMEIMPSSVASIRLTSVLDKKGNVSVRASYLRVGRKSDTHVKSETNFRIPVNPKTGELSSRIYQPNYATIEKHLDTNISVSEKIIPSFNKLISAAIELHKLVPFVNCIGWDMILDENNHVKVMEYNTDHNDIKFTEATQGPCFADLGWEKLWKKSD